MELLQKIENIENALHRNHLQQGWLHTYTKLSNALKEHTDRLYELNKQQTANSKETEDLSRYETFESIQDRFLSMRLLDKMCADNKQALQRLLDDVDLDARKEEDERNLLTKLQKELDESKRHMRVVSDKVEQIYHIQGARNVLNVDLQSLPDIISNFRQKREALSQAIAEQENSLSSLQAELNTLRTSQQALAPHRSMLSQGSHLLLCLSVMNNLKSELDIIDTDLSDNSQKQQALSNDWNNLSLSFSNLESAIQSLNTQLQRHRESIAGTDSLALQKRALTLDNQQKLFSYAQIHWRHIKQGYNDLESISATLSALRNRMEGVRVALTKVNAEVSELQTEYRYHAAVLQAKIRQQEEWQKELTELQTQHEMLNRNLEHLRERQRQLVDEWQNYATLDTSLIECSPSTNMEARTEMLVILKTKTERSAKEALDELEVFHFHQQRMQALNAELHNKETERAEIAKQMNDVDTERQVLQRQAEYLNKIHTTFQARFTALYNEINDTITLPGWMKEWLANNEGLQVRISDMVERWDASLLQSRKLQRDMQEVESLLSFNREQAAFVDTCIQRLSEVLESRATMLEEGEKDLQRVLDNAKEEDFYETSFQRLLAAYEAVERQTAEYIKASSQLCVTQGRHTALQSVGKRMEEQFSLLRFNLDVWINQYNASHSPVQYDELKRTFSLDTDWNSIRQRQRLMQQSIALEREMIKYLNTELSELKATSSRASTDISELTLWTLQTQMDNLRQQYREIALHADKGN